MSFLHAGGLGTLAAFAIGLGLIAYMARREGFSSREIVRLVLAPLLSALLLARLAGQLAQWLNGEFHGSWWTLWDGGYSLGVVSIGGTLGLLEAVVSLRRPHRRSGWRMADFCAPGVALWWAGAQYDVAGPQLVPAIEQGAALAFLVLAVVLLILRVRPRMPGTNLIVLLAGYALVIVVRDALRTEVLRLGGYLTVPQFWALCVLMLAGMLGVVRWVDAQVAVDNKRSHGRAARLGALFSGVGGFLSVLGFLGLQAARVLRGWVGDVVILFLPLGILGLLVGRFLLMRSRQAEARVLRERPAGPLVVYLRSFTRDQEYTRTYLEGEFELPLTEEESLRDAFRPFGKLIAIGNPRDAIQPPGASRAYLGEDGNWQAQVREWTGDAELVLIQAGHSDGLRWEIVHVLWTVPPERILFLLTFPGWRASRQKAYAAFREFIQPYVAGELPAEVGTAQFLSFDTDWTPHLHGPHDLPWLMRFCARMNHDRTLIYEQMLRPFFRKHGRWVRVWNPTAIDIFRIIVLVAMLLLLCGVMGFLVWMFTW